MADEIVGAESVSSDETATASSGLAAEQTDTTQGDPTHETPDPTTDTSEPGDGSAETPDPDDDEEEAPPENQTDEEKRTRSAERRERRQKREQERIDKAVTDAVAARDAKAASDAEVRSREAAATRAAEAQAAEFADLLGVPDAPGKPGTLTVLQQELAETNRQIRSEIVNPQLGVDTDALTEKANAIEARLATLTTNNTLAEKIQAFIWGQIGGGFNRVGEIPEMGAHPEVVKSYLSTQDPYAAQVLLADTVRKDVTARKDAEISTLTTKHASQVNALQTEVRAWRVKAGGSEASPASGGTAASGGGNLTYERYQAMPYEDRMKLRATPEGRAQIDAMTRTRATAG